MGDDLSGQLLELLYRLASVLDAAFLEIDPDQPLFERSRDARYHGVQAASLLLR